MKKEVFSFLKNLRSKEPHFIDSLIISSFVYCNNIEVKKNEFILRYIITKQNLQEYKTFIDLTEIIKQNPKSFDFESLIELFEFVVSPQDKIITGAVYTPKNIRTFIIDSALTAKQKDIATVKIADIACGCGSFLYDVAKQIKNKTGRKYFNIFKEQIYGLDIQQFSKDRTEILLTLLAISENEDIIEFSFNLNKGDALEFKWTDIILDFNGFDIIVGNPPYVCSRSIPRATMDLLINWEVCKTGHPDLYIPFFQIGIDNLIDNGFLGFITMNTFFKSLNGRALRLYFQRNTYSFKIIDFGAVQVFKSKSTYTCICIIEKKTSSYLEFTKCTDLETLKPLNEKFYHFEYNALNAKSGWNLNASQKIISKIESTGTSLSKKFNSRNGIATLKNNIYIFNFINEDDQFYYLKSDEIIYAIEKSICKEIVNPNLLTSAKGFPKQKQKIIFPYEFTKNGISVINEIEFKANFPNAYLYLKSNKNKLDKRDKGKAAKYNPWFMFGRNQSLEKLKFKLLFPHITPKLPNYVIDANEDLLFYNGMAIIGKNKTELNILKKLLSSNIFWFYIINTSKPYGSNYFSLSKNYIKNFGIPNFSDVEKSYIISENDQEKLNRFFAGKYAINPLDLII